MLVDTGETLLEKIEQQPLTNFKIKEKEKEKFIEFLKK